MRTSQFNAVLIMGRLTHDPQLEYAADGVPFCRFTIATTKRFTKADGSRGESTVSVAVTAQRRLAEICAQFLRQGREVFVAGTLTEAQCRGRRGTKPTLPRIAADTVQFISSSDGNARTSS